MNAKRAIRFLAFATATTIGVLGSTMSAWAQFQAAEIDQDRYLSVAIPGGTFVPYQLWLVRPTQPGANCFSVTGSDPGVVEPLWRENINQCATASDSNGYSVLVGGDELGSAYSLVVKQSGDELVLLGQPLRGQPITIGRTGGISSNGYTEIELLPGWRLTQRTYQGQPLGHFYYTNDLSLAELLAQEDGVAVNPTPTPTPTPLPDVEYPFPDIEDDVYAAEIAAAADQGIVAGGQDGRFNPRRPVTREEAASIVVEALETKGELNVSPVTAPPFPDVPVSRWSAQKIALLEQYDILAGDPSGNFRPGDPITRAELMSIARRTAEVVASLGGSPVEEIEPTGDIITFSDIDGHWNEATITVMSAYCDVATPYNERGEAFRPNEAALRNYTTAAVFRTVDCGSTPLE